MALNRLSMAAIRNLVHCLPSKSTLGVRSLFTYPSLQKNVGSLTTSGNTEEPKKISKAMKAYMERAKQHDDFINQQLHNYNIGKRHLANMMGRDPAFFTQEDIDESIKYLFPSGLFDPRARPMMKHPEEIFPKRKEAEFDMSGRPFHFLFYTSKPNYFSVLHDLNAKLQKLNIHEDRYLRGSHPISKLGEAVTQEKLNLGGTEWLPKLKLEKILLEKITDKEFSAFTKAFDRFVQHPFAYMERDFIMQYRHELAPQTMLREIPALMQDKAGRPYVIAKGKRKRAEAEVKVIGSGSGRIEINGQDILYFESKQDREQILFPLELTQLLGRVDIVATVSGGGHAGQAGAIRHAISLCLRSFVTAEVMEKMRLAGLLTQDPRVRERKKPGQVGARKKYTWKRR